eukprot:76134_1
MSKNLQLQTMAHTTKVLELILEKPQTIHTITKSLQIQKHEAEAILNELGEKKFIEIHEHKLDRETASDDHMQFLFLSEPSDPKTVTNHNQSQLDVAATSTKSSLTTPAVLKPKRMKTKSMSQRKRKKKFKPPRFVVPKSAQTIGKKRKRATIDNDEDKEEQPNKKRRKYNETKPSKYREEFLIAEIDKLKATIATNTTDKKDEQCLEYEELKALTEKWTVATQEIMQEIIRLKNDPEATVANLLQYFQIDPKQVRWNVEDQEFE